MILAERFVTGSGWVEIVVLGCYASFIFTKMRDPKAVSKWRLRIWRFFSIVFFTQLVLGLSGIDGMLMTGRLHLPIPAVILAGPIYRGEGFFMPVLFLSTIILVGPAWCSHLCYIGAWDNTAALTKKRANTSGKSFLNWRIGIFIFVVFYSFFSRIFSAPLSLLIFSAALFGIVGIGIMVSLSRRSGKMIHCTVFCPIGLLANLFGKISPLRISIDNSSCSSCFKCSSTCRFEALTKDDIQNRAPGLTCTLCGDCVGRGKNFERFSNLVIGPLFPKFL